MTTSRSIGSRYHAADAHGTLPDGGDTSTRASFRTQMTAIATAGEADMLCAARLEDELNRTNAFAKLMEAGPKAAKDLLA